MYSFSPENPLSAVSVSDCAHAGMQTNIICFDIFRDVLLEAEGYKERSDKS